MGAPRKQPPFLRLGEQEEAVGVITNWRLQEGPEDWLALRPPSERVLLFGCWCLSGVRRLVLGV